MADSSRFTIICPCCEATLTIDAQTGALISHDENQTRLERGANDLPFRIFSQANQVGFNLSLSARY